MDRAHMDRAHMDRARTAVLASCCRLNLMGL